MGQWGRPAHKGVRHNQRVRGGGTWSDQDRRLKWHMQLRWWRKRGMAQTWSATDRKLNRRPGWQFDRLVSGILLAGTAVTALSIGGRVLFLAIIAGLGVMGWRRVRAWLGKLPGGFA